jgi:hypothetical protein
MENLPNLDPQTLLPMLLAVLPILLAMIYVPAILLDVILHRALAHCAPASRTMSPWLVWLGLIPIFGLFWSFRVVRAVASSLHNEFERHGIAESPAPGKPLGMAWATLSLLSAIPLLNFVTMLPGAICWALYCIQVATLTRKLDDSKAVVPG